MILKIYGPPGTGKTRYLLELFEEELERVSPKRIAFLTFTRAARQTALERSGRSEDELPYLRTVHAICYRQLGMTQGQIVKPKDIVEFGKKVGVELKGNLKNPWSEEDLVGWTKPAVGDILLQLNHLGRHRQLHLKDTLRFADLELDLRYARWFTIEYRNWKTRESLLDYTDLLTEYLARGEPLDIDVMFIDEAQDLSRLQWDVVNKLGSNAQRIYLAGDDDQTIFTWAGADARRFIGYQATHEVTLGQSFRLPSRVHAIAQKVSSRIRGRYEKQFKPREAEGMFKGAGKVDPSLFIGPTFVLFRNHIRGHELARELQDISVPFTGETGVLSYPEVRNALSGIAKAIKGEPLSYSEAQAVTSYANSAWLTPKARGIVTSNARRAIYQDELLIRRPDINSWMNTLTRLPGRDYLSKCVRFYGFDRTLNPSITLMSIHQSKGREADTVVLDLSLTRRTFDAWMQNPDDEHRVWYVGVTRARERLFTLLPITERSYEL